MAKYFSPEFFALLQESLVNDAKWQDGTKGLKTSMKLSTTDQDTASAYLLKVEEGKRRSMG